MENLVWCAYCRDEHETDDFGWHRAGSEVDS